MPIAVNLDVMMARRKMSLNELAGKVDITLVNPFDIKDGEGKGGAIRYARGICKALDCQPGIGYKLFWPVRIHRGFYNDSHHKCVTVPEQILRSIREL